MGWKGGEGEVGSALKRGKVVKREEVVKRMGMGKESKTGADAEGTEGLKRGFGGEAE